MTTSTTEDEESTIERVMNLADRKAIVETIAAVSKQLQQLDDSVKVKGFEELNSMHGVGQLRYAQQLLGDSKVWEALSDVPTSPNIESKSVLQERLSKSVAPYADMLK